MFVVCAYSWEEMRKRNTRSKKRVTDTIGCWVGMCPSKPRVSSPLLKRQKLKRNTRKDKKPDKIIVDGLFRFEMTDLDRRMIERMIAIKLQKSMRICIFLII